MYRACYRCTCTVLFVSCMYECTLLLLAYCILTTVWRIVMNHLLSVFSPLWGSGEVGRVWVRSSAIVAPCYVLSVLSAQVRSDKIGGWLSLFIEQANCFSPLVVFSKVIKMLSSAFHLWEYKPSYPWFWPADAKFCGISNMHSPPGFNPETKYKFYVPHDQ